MRLDLYILILMQFNQQISNFFDMLGHLRLFNGRLNQMVPNKPRPAIMIMTTIAMLDSPSSICRK
ncbi:hypothetical protein PAALTS15_01427 [Paenibacillus alvei TS-15]|uniref:Uncharacterized protein n=1 Tax=Paenibacillus alvei TS-15 TaxID=1117108 RepID=S9UF03_PAEAL|nr:hypothetical protein PAALTS15_01427 [Paenibacillus alvei TS-15]